MKSFTIKSLLLKVSIVKTGVLREPVRVAERERSERMEEVSGLGARRDIVVVRSCYWVSWHILDGVAGSVALSVAKCRAHGPLFVLFGLTIGASPFADRHSRSLLPNSE